MTTVYANQMDCQECGQRVLIRQRHTYVDCCLYTVDHLEGSALRGDYARAMAFEIRELRKSAPSPIEEPPE